MKIRYNEYVANPALRHTETNLPAHVAQSLIAQGVAAHVPYTSVKDRIESEAALLPKPAAPVIEWGMKEAGMYTPTTVIKRVGSETTFFKTLPPDCPPSIVARFKQLTDGVEQVQELPPDEAKALEGAYRKGDSNKSRDVVIGRNPDGTPKVWNRERSDCKTRK